MTTYKILILLLCFITIEQVTSQTTYSICYKHSIPSQNDNYHLLTIPFDNIEQTSTGKTMVFNSDSVKIYEIERYFELADQRKELFLSDNGETMVYLIDREFKWEGVLNKSIEIFKNGVSFKQFQLIDLIDCDSDNEDCYLFYKEAIDTIVWEDGKRKIIFKEHATAFEKQLTERATFLSNDTLYIFAKSEKLILIDLKTTNLKSTTYSEIDQEKFKQIKPVQTKSQQFNAASSYGFPDLSSGLSLEKGLAKNLDMAVFPKDTKGSNKFKRYSVNLQIIVDKEGNATLDKMDTYSKLPKDKIKKFITSQKFVSNSIPSETEKWRFSGWMALMNKNRKEAIQEKKQEIIEKKAAYQKHIVADSINGLYIPQNLEECFLELNKILKPKDIEALKNLKDRNETILYHHGLGTWLRNNWRLWGGSRLQQYLKKKGLIHPDNMSATILEYYYDWLNEQHEKWKEFEAT